MKRLQRRSTGVQQAATAPLREAPAESELAFDALYRESRDDVFAYVSGLLRDVHAAEDVTALAFERAYRKRRRFDPRRGARSRLDLRRSPATPRSTSSASASGRAGLLTDPVDAESATTEEGAELAMRRAVLRDAVSGLELRERELIALRFFAGLSHAEIAQVLGISASNAGTRLHRAIDKLRRACDENA